MPALLDVLFSMILGLTIVLIIINANSVVSEGWFMFNGQMLVQQMLISSATLIEGEFRNMGFGVDKNPTTNTGVILDIGVDHITFASDINRNGMVNQIRYFLGDTDDVSFQNEMVRYLHRQVDGGTVNAIGLVTQFNLRYFNREGDEINPASVTPGSIGNVHLVEIEMEIQNPHALYRDPRIIREGEREGYYATSMWRQTRLGSKNFQTR
jgi:hypothetical protein